MAVAGFEYQLTEGEFYRTMQFNKCMIYEIVNGNHG